MGFPESGEEKQTLQKLGLRRTGQKKHQPTATEKSPLMSFSFQLKLSLTCVFPHRGQQAAVGHTEHGCGGGCELWPAALKVKQLPESRARCPCCPAFWMNWVMGVPTTASACKALTVQSPDRHLQ